MKCTKEDGTLRRCPYRICKQEFKPINSLNSSGDIWTDEFYYCLKSDCVAYDERSDECMRLKKEE